MPHAVAEYIRPYEAAGTPLWPRVDVRYQLSSLGTRPVVEKPCSAGGHPRRFFRIPEKQKQEHKALKRDGDSVRRKKIRRDRALKGQRGRGLRKKEIEEKQKE